VVYNRSHQSVLSFNRSHYSDYIWREESRMHPSASTATPREVFERALQSMQDVQMDVYTDLFAADAIFELPFAPPGIPRRIEGREAIRAFIQAGADSLRTASPQWQFRSVVVHERSTVWPPEPRTSSRTSKS